MYFTRTYSERTIHRFDGLFDGLSQLFGAVRCLELFALTHRPSVADTDTGRSSLRARTGRICGGVG